jgi:hypothetical protein
MKKILNPLLFVVLCLVTFFSCESNSATASLDGEAKSTNQIDKNNSNDKRSKKEVLDRMNKANNANQFNKTDNDSEVAKMVDAVKHQKNRRLGEDQAKQSTVEQMRRYEKVKDQPATADQKAIANQVCNCLNENPLFTTAKKSKSGSALIKSLGEDKDNEVRAMQNCYNNIMVPAVRNLGDDAGVFSKKAREELNDKCLDGKNNFWIHLGEYLTRNNTKVDPEKGK